MCVLIYERTRHILFEFERVPFIREITIERIIRSSYNATSAARSWVLNSFAYSTASATHVVPAERMSVCVIVD